MTVLPHGWISARLSDALTSYSAGIWGSDPIEPGVHVDVIRNGDIARDGTITGSVVRSASQRELAKARLSAGDVLITTSGEIGKVTLIRGEGARPLCASNFVRVLRSRQGVLTPGYLRYFLSTASARESLVANAGGTTIKNLRTGFFHELELPIAPLGEQGRIVAALDEQFSRLDGGLATLASVRQKLKRMRAAVLDAAVTGRLVPRDPNANASTALIARLREEARDRGKRKRAVLDTSHLPSAPASWNVVTLAALAESIDYGTSKKTRSDAEGIPILRMGNLGWGTIACRNLKFLAPEQLDQRLLLQPGDMLFNRTNSAELVGKTAVFHGYPGPISFASYLIRVRALPSADLDWASLVLNSAIGRRYVASVRNQQVGQANVNGTKLAAAPIPLPSADEQARIVTECARWFSVLDVLDSALATAVGRGERLRASILAIAFAGQLARQDPDDEPATVLLDRIAAERTASNGRASAPPRRARTPRQRVRA